MRYKAAKHDTVDVIDYIHADVWGLVDETRDDAWYFLTFVDDFSTKVRIFFLKHVSKVLSCFMT